MRKHLVVSRKDFTGLATGMTHEIVVLLAKNTPPVSP